MWRIALLATALIIYAAAAIAGFSIVQVANNTVPAGGFLLDNSSGFLLNDASGKLLAR